MKAFLIYLLSYQVPFTYVPSKHGKMNSTFAAAASYVLRKFSYFMKKLNNLLSELLKIWVECPLTSRNLGPGLIPVLIHSVIGYSLSNKFFAKAPQFLFHDTGTLARIRG